MQTQTQQQFQTQTVGANKSGTQLSARAEDTLPAAALTHAAARPR